MNNKTLPPPISKSSVTTLFGGLAIVTGGFAATWYALQRQQARKEAQGTYAPWEWRLLQAQAAAGNPSRPHTIPGSEPASGRPTAHPQSEFNVDVESSQARTDRAVPDTPLTKSGASADSGVGPRPGAEPTPQHTRDGARVYTKAPAYIDDCDEHTHTGI